MARKFDRIIMAVIDGLGVGSAPDAAKFADQGADTLGRLVNHFRARLRLPTLERLGEVHPLFSTENERVDNAFSQCLCPTVIEKSNLESYWELLGLPTKKELTAFPQGFPPAIVEQIAHYTGRPVLVNRPYVVDHLLDDWGSEQLATGGLLLTTSGGSDLQIAAHEETISDKEMTQIARYVRLLFDESGVDLGVVRGITFIGHRQFRLVAEHTYEMRTPAATLIDRLTEANVPITCLSDCQEIQEKISTGDGVYYLAMLKGTGKAGCRRDPERMGQALMNIDHKLEELLPQLSKGDLLLVTASHGADPDFPGRGQTRERVPLMGYAPGMVLNEVAIFKKLSDVSEFILANYGIKCRWLAATFNEK